MPWDGEDCELIETLFSSYLWLPSIVSPAEVTKRYVLPSAVVIVEGFSVEFSDAL